MITSNQLLCLSYYEMSSVMRPPVKLFNVFQSHKSFVFIPPWQIFCTCYEDITSLPQEVQQSMCLSIMRKYKIQNYKNTTWKCTNSFFVQKVLLVLRRNQEKIKVTRESCKGCMHIMPKHLLAPIKAPITVHFSLFL